MAKVEQTATLDSVDRRILSALQADGRLTMAELSERVGLSPSPCWTRVKRLEEQGVIEKYVALLNHQALGLHTLAFVEITLDKHEGAVLEQVGAALARVPEVLEAHLVTGGYDYLVKVAVRDTQHFEQFLRETLFRIPGIRQSRTSFGLRAVKRATSADPLQIQP